MIRQPICVLLAHVDHGKTSILDKIRESSVAAKESGGITQAISAYQISLDKIKEIGGELINKVGVDLTIPGLLFIDSPGHEAFTTLRKRGGSIADIAIVVIDINDGEKPQTREVIEILKNSKTPFVIAVNKIDMLTGWRSNPDLPIIKNIAEQSDDVRLHFERKLYEIVASISTHGINSDRFDRVDDYTKKVAMIPISAKTGEGFPELLMILSGLAQKYLEESLKINVEGQAKGTILEVCEEKGVGKVLDAIIYDGTIKVNDTILIGVCDGEPIKTKVKCLFNLDKGKVVEEKEVHAAAAVKISASDLDEVIPGMPIRVCNKDEEKVKEELESEIEEVQIETDNEGIIVKADTLGSLEALTVLLRGKDIKIKKAKVGAINKQDIAEACSESNDLNKVIVGFNVKVLEQSKEVKIIVNDIIYKVIDDVTDWIENFGRVLEEKDLEGLVKPFKIQVMKNHIFRISNPAVVGVEVLAGSAKSNTPMMKDGKKICDLKDIQDAGKSIGEAGKGKEVAASFPGIMCGRQLKEEDILYSDVPERDFRKLKKLKKYLKDDEIQALKEIAELKRKDNPTWGI
jgi:translation initiation factor 5B